MVDTGFSVPPDKRHRLSSCHTWREGKLAIVDRAADSPFNEGFEFLSGGGGLISTMQDYANFCQMLVERGQFKGKRLLQEETVELMFTDQLNGVAGDFRFGLGFAIGEVTLGTGDRATPGPAIFLGRLCQHRFPARSRGKALSDCPAAACSHIQRAGQQTILVGLRRVRFGNSGER